MTARRLFQAKTAWHEDQRQLTPKEKVRIVLALQRRERDLQRARVARGRLRPNIVPWNTEP